MENRRVLLAILLCTAFWLAFSALQPLILPTPPAVAPGEGPGGGSGTEAGAAGGAAEGAGAAGGAPSGGALERQRSPGAAPPGAAGSGGASPSAATPGAAPPGGDVRETREVLQRLPSTTAAAGAWLREVQERRNGLETVRLENHWVRLEFVLPDATIERAWLKQYTREVVRDERERQDPTRWVPVIEPGTIGPRPLLVRDFFETDTSPLNHLTWSVVERQPGRSIRFEAPLADGTVLWKEVRLPPPSSRGPGRVGDAGLEVRLGLTAGPGGPALRRALFTLGASVYEESGRFYRGPTAVIRRSSGSGRESSNVYSLTSFKEGVTSKQDGEEGVYRNLWFGLSSQYFTIAARPLASPEAGGAVPASGEAPGTFLGVARTEPLFSLGKLATALADLQGRQGGAHDPNEDWKALVRQARKNLAISCEVRLEAPSAGASASRGFFVYLGPKDPTLLAREPYRVFLPVIDQDYGSFLGPVVRALVGLLRFFHWLTGNYGIAILLLTIAVRILIFPMSYKQQKAMARFQEAQQKLKPKIDELKARFKKNPKKLREEQMRLMQSEGVSFPLAGCLTLFLQMPIFIGLFQTLRVAFELRQQPFFGWILDLSQPDALLDLPFTLPILGSSKLNILPILMTVVWIVQMRMQPLPPDPQQAQSQKMMRFMPFLFGFFFYNYASGLSLYMFMNFLLGIGETKFLKPWLQRRAGEEAAATGVPAAAPAGRGAAKALRAAARQPVLPKKRR